MENKLLILNMKMYMDINDIKNYIKNVKIESDNVIICPTAIYLPYFVKNYKNVAIQNIYAKDQGAYTGAISSLQVKKMGVDYAVVGHSECRKNFKETNELINKKIKSALNNKMKIILCVGENLEENQSGRTKEVLKSQLEKCLLDINSNDIIIAYEPIFSIGTGNIPTDKEIKETIRFIKEELNQRNMNLKVVYGGSVNANNIASLSKIEGVDGFMVGKSSSIVEEVLKMIEVVSC